MGLRSAGPSRRLQVLVNKWILQKRKCSLLGLKKFSLLCLSLLFKLEKEVEKSKYRETNSQGSERGRKRINV